MPATLVLFSVSLFLHDAGNRDILETNLTNCGYKHNGTTHVVKTYIYVLDVSYTPAYIFRSNGYLNYN